MKSFRELTTQNESPVGKVGRTSGLEAAEHIEANGLEKKFAKIVKELGGKTSARLLLAKMNQSGDILESKNFEEESIEKYLRDVGFKIKSEEPTKNGKELEFFKQSNAEEAFEDLKTAGYGKKFDISLSHNTISYINK